MTTYQEVFENNKKWVESRLAKDANFFENLAKIQTPEFLFIGCSDSRVPANQIMGLQPGNVFVHRNIANLVDNIDLNVQSVIEYAVVHLKVKHVIVCGHYGCGGVQAAMKSQDLGLLNGWLRNIRDVYRIHHDELVAIENEDERYRRLVELNVQEQAVNVIKVASIQKSYLKNQFPTVHGWVYDLHNGYLKDLNINFDEALEGVRDIYHLEV